MAHLSPCLLVERMEIRRPDSAGASGLASAQLLTVDLEPPRSPVPNLSAVDWMIVLIYFFFVISIGLSLRQFISTRDDFLLAGRALPAWLCGLALVAASLGSLEVLGMGAAGARLRLGQRQFLRPRLHRAPALCRHVHDAGLLRGMRTGRSLCPRLSGPALRRQNPHPRTQFCFSPSRSWARPWRSTSWRESLPRWASSTYSFTRKPSAAAGVLIFSVALPAALVLIYVVLGGLGATMYAQVMQFFHAHRRLFCPSSCSGLKQIGGWSGMKSVLQRLPPTPPAARHGTGGTALAFAAAARHRAHRRLLVHGLQPAANGHGCGRRRLCPPRSAHRRGSESISSLFADHSRRDCHRPAHAAHHQGGAQRGRRNLSRDQCGARSRRAGSGRGPGAYRLHRRSDGRQNPARCRKAMRC